MNRFKYSLLTLLLVVGIAAGAAGKAQRFAVIDLDKVFREYYKSRIAEEAIRQQGEIYRSYLLKLNEQHQKLQQESARQLMNAQNIALSDAERQRSVRAAELKKREVEEKKAEIELYASDRSKDLRRIEEEKRAEIMREIMAEVKRRAAAEGYDFVLDSSGKSFNQQPVLLVYPSGDDLTDRVVVELNRRATPVKNNPQP